MVLFSVGCEDEVTHFVNGAKLGELRPHGQLLSLDWNAGLVVAQHRAQATVTHILVSHHVSGHGDRTCRQE